MKLGKALALLTVLAGPRGAAAQELTELEEQVEPRRIAVELYPLDWLIGRYGVGLEAMLVEHDAVNLSGYWADVTDQGISSPKYGVNGVGTELGYRFYSGARGPRGFFGGPSLLLGSFVVAPPGAMQYTAHHVGMAFDFGYQALVAHDFVLAIGAGAQWTWIDRDVPDLTSINASSLVNGGIRPRVMTTIGWAF